MVVVAGLEAESGLLLTVVDISSGHGAEEGGCQDDRENEAHCRAAYFFMFVLLCEGCCRNRMLKKRDQSGKSQRNVARIGVERKKKAATSL